MSSTIGDNNNSISQCAACNKVSDKLKKCGGCNQVKYCSSICQRSHWPKHKMECKLHAASSGIGSDSSMKLSGGETMALCSVIEQMVLQYENEKLSSSITDDELFRDPPPKEDCPICMLPMPHSSGLCGVAKTYQICCGKVLCEACVVTEVLEMMKGNTHMKDCCAFCRAPLGVDVEYGKCQWLRQTMNQYQKRMDLNDAGAFCDLAMMYLKGDRGFSQDLNEALKLLLRGADLGSISAHYSLSVIYYEGKVVKQDIKKAVYHLEIAAIGGHERARHNLGAVEEDKSNTKRAMKHFMIAAKAGFDASLKAVADGYKRGHVTKDEYAGVLRAHKDSQDEMKSEQRARAEVVHREIRGS